MPFPSNVRRWVVALQRRFAIQGALNPTVLDDLQPVVQLWDVRDPIAVRQRGERRYALDINSPAVAGQSSRAILQNPAGSGVVVVPELIMVVPNAVSATDVTTVAPGAAGTAGFPVDGLTLADQTSHRSRANVLAIAGVFAPALGFYAAAAEREVLGLPLVPPNVGLAITITVVNTGGRFTFYWREYPLAQGEDVVA